MLQYAVLVYRHGCTEEYRTGTNHKPINREGEVVRDFYECDVSEHSFRFSAIPDLG